MTRSGANYGQTACFKYNFDVYACADVLILRTNKKAISGGYLSTFFNTKQGKLLVERGGYGGAQPHIAPSYLKKLRIPRFSKLEPLINNLVSLSVQTQEQSQTAYTTAENLLLDALGLDANTLAD